MGQLAALSALGFYDVVDSSMFFELFTHVSHFFGFKVTLLGSFNGQNLPHGGEVSILSKAASDMFIEYFLMWKTVLQFVQLYYCIPSF